MYPPIAPEEDDLGQVPDPALLEDVDDENIEAEPEIPEEDESQLHEEAKRALKDLIFDFERKEQPTRERMLRFYRKHELYWDGVQDVIWDEVARDFKSVRDIVESDKEAQLDPYYYNKIVNIFRAYGEAVIAALTPETPTIVFPPDDADVIDDVNASKGYTRLSELIKKHNSIELLLCKAIFTLWNQGLVGCYSYIKSSPNFGIHQEPITQNVPQIQQNPLCPFCGSPNIQPDPTGQAVICPDCGQSSPAPEMMEEQIEVPTIVGYDEIPKSRVMLEMYGPCDFEIPHYVKDPKDTPYISLKNDVHVSKAKEIYGDLVESIAVSHDYESNDRWAREHTQYSTAESEEVTIRRVWLRNWTYQEFKDSQTDIYDYLMREYPNGVKVELVDEQVARCTPENMDDYWSFTRSPLSTHLHALPLGAPLLPLQEVRNELLLLKLQHVEYGIPETFADPQSLNFNVYNQNPAKPGMIYPAKASPGKSLDQSFTTLKTAQYPKEINDFQTEVDADSQFVVGAFPTIYGGANTGGGKTASEYNMSRNQALQRLSNIWKVVTYWYAESMGKAVVLFHENMLEDEKYVQKNGDRFETVWIRKSDLVGKVGQVEPEVSNNFPSSQAQKRDLLIEILQMQSEEINTAIFTNENSTIIQQLLGFPEFYIPGSDDRAKQLEEIQQLLLSQPLDPAGEMPSIQVDQQLDDHELEFECCAAWMKSDVGRDARLNNPAGFANVRSHALMHQFFMMQQQQAAMEQEAAMTGEANKIATKESETE